MWTPQRGHGGLLDEWTSIRCATLHNLIYNCISKNNALCRFLKWKKKLYTSEYTYSLSLYIYIYCISIFNLLTDCLQVNGFLCSFFFSSSSLFLKCEIKNLQGRTKYRSAASFDLFRNRDKCAIVLCLGWRGQTLRKERETACVFIAMLLNNVWKIFMLLSVTQPIPQVPPIQSSWLYSGNTKSQDFYENLVSRFFSGGVRVSHVIRSEVLNRFYCLGLFLLLLLLGFTVCFVVFLLCFFVLFFL